MGISGRRKSVACVSCHANDFNVDILFQRIVCGFCHKYLLSYNCGVWLYFLDKGGEEKKSGEALDESQDNKQTGREITHTPVRVWCGVAIVAIILWYAIWWMLVSLTDSTVPVADSFTTALSIVGLWMMARKYAEQWLIWFVVDIVCSGLYYYKGLPFYCLLYAIYTVIAILGYRKWLRMMR